MKETEEIITLGILNYKHGLGGDIAESDLGKLLPLKNLCVKVTEEFSQELESACGFLGVSKRQFVTYAISDALAIYRQKLDESKPCSSDQEGKQ